MKGAKIWVGLISTALVAWNCTAPQDGVNTSQVLQGVPICLDVYSAIPSFVQKFYASRDLATEEGKIDYLIERIRTSRYRFIRNDVEYNSSSAALFLRWKLNRLRHHHGITIETAQDFIDKVASGSRMTARPYLIELEDEERYLFKTVLDNELEALESCLLETYEAAGQEEIDAEVTDASLSDPAPLSSGLDLPGPPEPIPAERVSDPPAPETSPPPSQLRNTPDKNVGHEAVNPS